MGIVLGAILTLCVISLIFFDDIYRDLLGFWFILVVSIIIIMVISFVFIYYFFLKKYLNENSTNIINDTKMIFSKEAQEAERNKSMNSMFNTLQGVYVKYTFRQFVVLLLNSFVILLGSILGIYLSIQQNDLSQNQNSIQLKQLFIDSIQTDQINQQTIAQEASSKSVYMELVSIIFDQVKEDLKTGNELTDNTIATITSTVNLLKPYKYHLNDLTVSTPLSPEKGYILNYLLQNEISIESLNKIYSHTDFSYSDMGGAIITDAYLHGVKLDNSNLYGAVIYDSQLSYASFRNVNLDRVRFHNNKLLRTNFTDINFIKFYSVLPLKIDYLNQNKYLINMDVMSVTGSKRNDVLISQVTNKYLSESNIVQGVSPTYLYKENHINFKMQTFKK